MRIITEGRMDRMEKVIRFGCRKCGCVFDAGPAEYRVDPDGRNGLVAVIACPTCGGRVTADAETSSGADAPPSP